MAAAASSKLAKIVISARVITVQAKEKGAWKYPSRVRKKGYKEIVRFWETLSTSHKDIVCGTLIWGKTITQQRSDPRGPSRPILSLLAKDSLPYITTNTSIQTKTSGEKR